jgi:hypothetical protein
MTNDELKHIQAVCHGWLRQPGTANRSRMTIPAAGALSRTVEVVAGSLLTFDNVLFVAALDSETGDCYTTLISPQGKPGHFIDTPLDKFTEKPAAPEQFFPAALRATQKRYREAMELQPAGSDVRSGESETNTWWIETEEAAEPQPKYLLYTNQQLLGYSLLEHARAGGQRSGRFHPNENYFEYASIFEALPEVENDAFEANAREGYEIFDERNEEYRTRFNKLSARVGSLSLDVSDETGSKLEASEVRLEDLSRHFADPNERWLHVTVAQSHPKP